MRIERIQGVPEKRSEISRRMFFSALGRASAGILFAGGAVFGAKETFAQYDGTVERQESAEERRRKVHELILMIETHDVRQNMEYAKRKFGGAVDGLLNEPTQQIAMLDRLFREGNTEGADHESLRGSLAQAYTWFWDAEDIDRRFMKEWNLEPSRIEGFRKEVEGSLTSKVLQDGGSFTEEDAEVGQESTAQWFSNEEIRKILEERFEPAWLYGNTSVFRYVDREEQQEYLPAAGHVSKKKHQQEPHYRVTGRAFEGKLRYVFTRHNLEEITLFRQDAVTPEGVVNVVAHELGHRHDWENTNRLPIHERLEFLQDVAERIDAPDRWRSDYVESDIPKEYKSEGRDKKEMRYRQVKEYWATLTESYMDAKDREVMRERHPRDYQLVERWYERLAHVPGHAERAAQSGR